MMIRFPKNLFKKAQFLSPDIVLDLSQLGAAGAQKATEENPRLRMHQNMETATRAGDPDPAWSAAKQELALSLPRDIHLVTGRPFSNSKYLSQNIRPHQTLVEISGYGAGEQNIFGGKRFSDKPSDYSYIPEDSLLSYRWTDQAQAQHALDTLSSIGIPVALMGHSLGGDTVVQMAKDNPNIHLTAIDPVGRLHVPKRLPDNVIIETPTNRHASVADFVANVGGRYPENLATDTYSGDHVSGIDNVAHDVYSRLRNIAIKNRKAQTKPRQPASPTVPKRINWKTFDYKSLMPSIWGAPTQPQPKLSDSKGMEKESNDFTDWVKWVGKSFFKDNPPSGKETAARTVLGAGGAVLVRYLYDKTRKRKTKLRKLIGAALLGGGAGAFSGYWKNYMSGKPFENPDFSLDKIKKGDRVYFGVAGAANGEGEDQSWFADDMRSLLPKTHLRMFNWNDYSGLEKAYADVVARGGVPVVVGHSRGGQTAAGFLKKHPEAKGYLIDPVSWFGRSHPQNATVFTASGPQSHGGVIENYIADVGGRWNLADSGTLLYNGSHSDKNYNIIRDYVRPGYGRDNIRPNNPDYVTKAIL